MAQGTDHNAPPAGPMRPTRGVTPGSEQPHDAQVAPGMLGAGSLSYVPVQGNRPGSPSPSQGTTDVNTPPAPPYMFTDIDPVYLARLYPNRLAEASGPARDAAMADGQAAFDASMTVVAAQQDDQLPEDPNNPRQDQNRPQEAWNRPHEEPQPAPPPPAPEPAPEA